MKLLLVIDMQNDFIDEALGTPEAVQIVDSVVEEMANWDGPIICTRDTHTEDYLNTQEGRKLPVPHCIKGTHGWQLNDKIQSVADELDAAIFDKPSFGARNLPKFIRDNYEEIAEIELVGLCTDICVIANAMLMKAAFPETPIRVKASCCAGVTPEQHQTALEAMKPCQVEII